jgi:chromate transporter
MSAVMLFLLFLKASALAFGGMGGLPILHQDLAARNVADLDALIGQALAVARISPGPNGLYLVSLGYFLGRVPGAVAATVALALPPFVVLLIVAWYGRVQHSKRTENALLVLSFGLAGLLGFTSWQIIRGSSSDIFEWLIALAGFLATARLKLHPIVMIGVAGALGVVIYR